jgi:murein DD-endopeptidase MepM/ murein hydrolase activator NlpD
VKLGPFSSYGKYIKISHSNGLQTAYAHMNGFKPGLKNGSRVKQGQVIGYVGTTGRSTGPHLHFEVMQNGKQINPNSLKLPQSNQLAGKDLKKFKDVVIERDRTFGDSREADVVASRAQGPVRTAAVKR